MYDPLLYIHLAFGVLLTIVAYGLTWAMAKFVRIMDEPNHRSSHLKAVPRAGGVSIVIVFYTGLVITWLLGEFEGVAGSLPVSYTHLTLPTKRIV